MILAGIILFFVGRFAMTGPAFQPHILEGIDLHLGETVTSIGVFLFMIGLIGGLFTKPLAQAIEERTSTLERTFSEAEKLKADMDEAIGRKVFGSPYFIVDGEPFWGADRLEHLDRWLATGGW